MIGVASSNVAEVGYASDVRILFVRFRRGGLYRYFGVEPAVYRELLASESKGQFIQARIVSRPYREAVKAIVSSIDSRDTIGAMAS